jgi:integrase
MVHLAAWSGLRAAELAGLTVGDVILPKPSLNPQRSGEACALRVDRTVARIAGELTHVTPKTKGSRRTVPLTAATTELQGEYIAEHPRPGEPTAPLFPVCGYGHPAHRYQSHCRVDGAAGNRTRNLPRRRAPTSNRPDPAEPDRRRRATGPPTGTNHWRTPRSTRPCTARRCCGPTGLPPPPSCPPS